MLLHSYAMVWEVEPLRSQALGLCAFYRTVSDMATRNQAFDSPNSTVAVDADGNLTTAYLTWISRMTIIGQTIQQSGVTTDRPNEVLWIGRQFYDTTLNKPVYVSAVKPTVWRDAAGTIV